MLKTSVIDKLQTEYDYKDSLLVVLRSASMKGLCVPTHEDIQNIESRLQIIREDVEKVTYMSFDEVCSYINDVILKEVQG